MANNIKGITIEVGGNTVGLTKALDGVNKQSSSLQKELREVEKLLKLDPKNTELLEQKQKLLGKSVETTKEKLEALKDAEKQVQQQVKEGKASEEQYRALQREIVKTEQEMKRLESKTKDTSGAMDLLAKNSDKINNVMKTATYSFVAAGAGLVGMAAKAGAAADDINTLAKQTGLSTEEIQKFKYATEIIDVPLETLTKSMAKLTKSMQSTKEVKEMGRQLSGASLAFEYLGVSVLDINGKMRSNDDVFAEVIGKLGKMENETQRDAYAMQIFGKSAQDLNPLILGGADALKELGQEAEDAGLILSQDALDGANEFNDAIDKIKATTAGAFGKIGGEIARELTPVVDDIAESVVNFMEWFLKNKDGIITAIAAIGAALLAWNVGKMISSVILAVQGLSAALTGAAVAQTALNTAMNANVIGLVLMAVAALGIGIYALIKSQNYEIEQSKKLVEQAEQERQAYEQLRAAQEEKAQASLSELANTQQLWQELQTLADENGAVTEANQARAQFIMGELNTALGTEMQMINGKITGMQGEQTEIDKLIEKKRAQIYLESLEPAYREAISASLEKEKSLREQETAIVEQQSEVEAAQAQLRAAQAQEGAAMNGELIASESLKLEKEKQILNDMQNAYLLDKENYKLYLEDKNDYESAAAAMMEGNYQALENIVVGSTQRTYQTADSLVGKSKDDQMGILGEQYAGALTYLSDYAIKHKQGVEGYTADGLKEAENYATSAKTEYEKVGGAVVDGTIEGMDKKKINVKNTIAALFNSIPEWARKILKIESPSKVMRDEVGKYIVEGTAQGIKDNRGVLKAEMEGLIDEVKIKVKDLQTYIDGIEKEIKELGKEKKAANKEGKAAIDELIQSKRDEIDSVKENIKTLQDEQKAYEDRAKSYIEASELIKKGLTGATDNIGLTKDKSSNTYKLWLAVYGEGATEAEKLQKQEESLTDQFNIQGKTVEATEAAYQLMVEHYGESYEGSRKLENQLLQERIAYEELYNSIIDVREAKPEAGLKETTETNDLDKTRSSDTYKLWLAVHGETATEAEKLQKQEESLTEQYKIQGETVESTEAAYQSMVEQNGESCEGSRKLENQLLQERIAYEELYNSIIDVREAKSELTENSATNLRAAQTSYGDFLSKNYKTLSSFGISASDIFASARSASGLDKAESAVKSITVNQNITTTAATPSEIREAARDGATLATKEAYA